MKSSQNSRYLSTIVRDAASVVSELEPPRGIHIRETGYVTFVGPGIARIRGLNSVGFQELVLFENNQRGIVMNLDRDEISVILLEESDDLEAGMEVQSVGSVMNVPVGEAFLGRVINPMGRVLDGGESIRTDERMPINRDAPAIMERAPVTVPIQTGLRVIDALIPLGRGQRELILGDRQTGKTAIAVDAMINQKNFDVICIYCAIGKRKDAVTKVVADLKNHDAMDNTIVVTATGDDTPGMNYLAPYAATTLGEYFMDSGRDVLVVFDDLTRHAWSYRELSLLMRRPPAREAYPSDIFYIHARLLERSTHKRDEMQGGSLTALPIIETQSQNLSAYIPTNLISITDGQIYLSPKLFKEGILPAVDVGTSVSRVGGKTQLPAYRDFAGNLRLSYSQYEELESFARFGTKLDEETKHTLERGRRVREVLKQPQFSLCTAFQQIIVLICVNEGLFDSLPIDMMQEAIETVQERVPDKTRQIGEKIEDKKSLEDEDRKKIVEAARKEMDNLQKVKPDQ